MRAARRITTWTLLAAALAATTGCASSAIVPPARLSVSTDQEPPRIVAPAPGKRHLLDGSNVKALPEGMRGWLPAYDGDTIAVVLTPAARKDVTARSVRDEVIAPILRAIGFTRDIAELRMPPEAGVPLPRPQLAPLARAVALEYAGNPGLLRPRTREMLDSFAQYVPGIERREIVFPFTQVHRGIPIEYATLLATAWEGESVRSVQGALLGDYTIDNSIALDARTIVPAAIRWLKQLRRFQIIGDKLPPRGPRLVLLPFGTDATGRAVLRYAYRMVVEAAWRGREGSFLLWADAENGKLLALEPMMKPAGAVGRTFNRDPGVAGTLSVPFEVDAPVAGKYTLARGNVSIRLNYRAGSYDGSEVEIPAATGSPTPPANFDQPWINDPAGAVCATPGGEAANKYFQQVSLFATAMRHHDTVVGGGIFQPFPASPWAPTVEYSAWGCNADMGMQFGMCPGYSDPLCPDAPNKLLNPAHDNTIVAHELGHSATSVLAEGRPWDWCAPGTTEVCDLPRGWGPFHDLADFWGAHLESTNCIGGWMGKNMNGTNASRYCHQTNHNERSGFPRKLEVTAGVATGDHFPEHRRLTVTPNQYADGQIAGAALWEVRAGMRSKSRASGVTQFGVRFQRALIHAGFFNVFEPGNTDLGTSQRLVELEFKMVEQWATSGLVGGPPTQDGTHTTNKVTAGFARAGLFLLPWQCLDGDPGNDARVECPVANPGADAVIDVDDDDTGDDDEVNNVTVVDRDFLRLAAAPIPKFHVWTGPRYRLDGAGGATNPTPAPCNDKLKVEVTTDPTFATITAQSPWIIVNRDPSGAAPTCYATWSPTPSEWAALRAGGAPSQIYYRARTQDISGGTERLSTRPGNGLWTVPPPYAVITVDGRSDY